MVRNYKKKTENGETPPDVMLRAVRNVNINKVSIRKSALEFKINYRTLAKYCKNIPEKEQIDNKIVTPTIKILKLSNIVIKKRSGKWMSLCYIVGYWRSLYNGRYF